MADNRQAGRVTIRPYVYRGAEGFTIRARGASLFARTREGAEAIRGTLKSTELSAEARWSEINRILRAGR